MSGADLRAGALPRITAGITCHNAAPTIARAVASACAQDWPELEIVIVDDGSTDGSAALLQALAARDRRIRLICQAENRGAASARNAILQSASGALIAFFDDDDVSHPERLRRQYQHLLAHEAQAANRLIACYASGLRRYDNGYDLAFAAIGSRDRPPRGEALIRYLLLFDREPGVFYGNGTPSCSLMARRHVFAAVGAFDETLQRQEDADWAIRLARLGGAFIGTPDCLIEQFVTRGPEKRAIVEHESLLRLIEKNADYLKSVGAYHYARGWAEIRYRHFNREPVLVLAALLRLMLRHPIRAGRHFAISARRRFIHERRMARRPDQGGKAGRVA